MPINSRKAEPMAPMSPPPAPAPARPAPSHDDFAKKIFMVLACVVLVYLTMFLGSLMRNNLKKYYFIGMADQMERTISVTGFGKVSGKNDIAVTTIGYTSTDKDVAKAQAANKKVMDQVYAELKNLGIDEGDLQSNYTIYPEYDYTSDKGQVFKGYRVNNSVTVKIRDLKKISSILDLPGKFGATEVGGLSFTIDDVQNLKSAAREKALDDARAKASKLARSLGVGLGEIISYSDYEAQPDYYYNNGPAMFAEKGMGGGVGPADVSAGSKDVGMNVTITYKIYTSRW